MMSDRRRFVYRGRVQGVGFRASVRRLAGGFSVTGFVRNLPDGSVEVVACGEVAELDRFHAAIVSEFSSQVRSTEISAILAESSEPSDFSIRY